MSDCSTRSLLLSNMKKILLTFVLFASMPSYASSALAELDSYGRALERSTQNAAIVYKKSVQTTETPLKAYKLTFSTNSKAFMSLPNAKEDRVAFVANRARTEVWQRKFCNISLEPIFRKHRINLISGDLTNLRGETQSLALCTVNELHGEPLTHDEPKTPNAIVGSWYDNLNSPNFMDATLTIYTEADRHFIKRKNGDGSEGRYIVTKSANTYTKVGDKHGAYYVVTEQGLKIYDRNGYIRTAAKSK